MCWFVCCVFVIMFPSLFVFVCCVVMCSFVVIRCVVLQHNICVRVFGCCFVLCCVVLLCVGVML